MKLKKKKNSASTSILLKDLLEVRDKGPIRTKSLQAFGAYLKYNRREPLIYANSYCLMMLKVIVTRLHGEGNGTPLQCSCLENPKYGGAWKAEVHGVAESRTRLSDFTFTFHFHALEKEMATHSSVLAWGILGTGEPGGLPSMGSHGVGHD